MAFIQQDFRRNILRSPANRVCTLLDDFCEAKVNQLQVTIRLDHDVLRLEVPVDYILGLKVFEDADYLRPVKFSLLGGEMANSAVIGEKVPAFQ